MLIPIMVLTMIEMIMIMMMITIIPYDNNNDYIYNCIVLMIM